jgi:S-adenosylmethionine hydrolase
MKKKSPSAPKEIASRDSPIITLLSDFGVKDPYVASMKGVILSICRKARIVDITHDIAKFNILQGAYALDAAIPYFPPGSIHVAVVDPSVGTKRKALIVETKRSHLIGPDNGVLMLAGPREGIERVFEIRDRRYMLSNVSPTFHGRDVFCAVAAHLANGTPVDNFGPETNDYTGPGFAKPSLTDDQLSGEIIRVDDFGNIVTNITSKDLTEFGVTIGSTIGVAVGSVSRDIKFCRTYGDVDEGDHVALIGSTGFFEISVNRGNAASFYGAREGTRLRISRC